MIVAMEGSSSTPPAVSRFGIGARIAALVCGMVALTCVAGGVWTYLNLSRRLIEQELGRQHGVIEAAAAQLVAGVEALRSDVAFLADVPAIRVVVRSLGAGENERTDGVPEQAWEDRLVSIFEAKMRATPPYAQIRLIGQANGGREVIRVERVENRVVAVSEDKLQQKGERPYFREAIQMSAGRVYLSDIELNQEWGQVANPEVPVLRAASPVRLPNGELFGIVVINKDMRSRFQRMREILASRYSLFLFDEGGNVLMYSTPNQEYVLPVNSRPQLEERFPQARDLFATLDLGYAVLTDTTTGEKVVATLRVWNYDPERPDRYFGLLLTSSYDAAISLAVADRTRTTWFGLLLLAVTMGTTLAASRKITRPLRQITQAVEDFAKGEQPSQLPIASGDEAGTLAKAFDHMSRQVREQRAALVGEVAERRSAEELLRESERQLRLALDAAQAGTWVLDARANLNVWDERLERMFGLEPHTFSGTFEAWAALVHPEDREQAIADTRRALEEQQPYQAEFRAGRDGCWRHIKSQAVVVRDSEENPTRMVGVCWDITESKRAEEEIRRGAAELERKNREMEQFVYSVSHDLKSPVVTVKGFLGILSEDLQTGRIAEALNSMQRLGHATQRMGMLIDDLLQFSRIGRGIEKPESVDIPKLVRELAEEEQQLRGAANVHIEIQDDMPQIIADPSSVARLFQNLLANALKYGLGAAEPRIEVGGEIASDQIRFYVRDNGLGIPKEYQSKIFGLFQRLDNSQEGTGIGLAVVNKIMDAYGGRAWVESDSGQGATFWLAFPRRFLAAAPPAMTRSMV